MFKRNLKTIAQMLFLWAPVIYVNTNFEKLTKPEIITLISSGIVFCGLAEIIYRLTKR